MHVRKSSGNLLGAVPAAAASCMPEARRVHSSSISQGMRRSWCNQSWARLVPPRAAA